MYKRADGRYQKQIVIGHTEEGKPIRKYIYADTKSELEKKYREFMNLYEKGIAVSEEELTMQQLSELWFRADKEGQVSQQSLVRMKRLTAQAMKIIGQVPVSKLTAYHLEEMRDVFKNSPSTFNHALKYITSMLKFAVQRDIVYKNVALAVKPIKFEKRKKRALTPYEIQMIDSTPLNISDRAMIDILRYTGIRRGEMLALTTDDILWERNSILIHATFVEELGKPQEHTKTEAGMREISMPKKLQKTLKEYTNTIEEGLLFFNRDGNYMREPTFIRRWNNIRTAIFGEDAPNDFTPHIFRHNYASDLYKAGVDLKTAQYLLGHTDIKTTMDTYTHFSSVDVNIDKLERYYENNFSQDLVKNNIYVLNRQ